MKYELKPCPFCGSTTAPTVMTKHEASWMSHEEREMFDGDMPMVVCCAAKKGGCGASTGFCDDEDDFGMQAAIAWNTRASGWIPCSERMPESGLTVHVYGVSLKGLGYNFDAYVTSAGEWRTFDVTARENGIRFWGDVAHDLKITHWMPIAKRPEEV